MKKIFSIKKFPGLIQKADTRDVPYATKIENVDATNFLGIIVPAKGYSDTGLDWSSEPDLRQFIEYLNPQHDNNKVFLVRQKNVLLGVAFDTGSGYGTEYYKSYTYRSFTDIDDYIDALAKMDNISLVERNGVVYGGTGVGEDRSPFIFLLTNYKRFEDWDNADTWYDDWTLENEPVQTAYLLEQSELIPPLNEHVRLQNLGSSALSAFTSAKYDNFVNGTYGFFFTFVYDGFQESGFKNVKEEVGIGLDVNSLIITYNRIAQQLFNKPLDLRAQNDGLAYTVPTSSANTISFNIDLKVANIPRRVTAINIYMSLLDGKQEKFNKSETRLVKTIPIDNRQQYLGRSEAYTEFYPIGQTSKWDDQGSGWWRFMEEPRDSATVYISSYDFLYGRPWISSLGYNATTKLFPKYKYNHALNDTMYAGPVEYDGEYFANIFVWSPPGQFSLLPFTNRQSVKGEITAINSIRNYILVFTLSDCYIFDENKALNDVKYGIGCYSHWGIVEYSNYKYWPTKNGFVKFDGFKEEKISDYFVENTYKGLTEDQKKSISGAYLSEADQIIWTVPNVRTFIYNLKDGTWSTRDYGFRHLGRNTTLDVYATDGTGVFKLNDTYLYDDEEYTATYQLDNLDDGDSTRVKTLTLGYIKYKSLDTITLTFMFNGQVLQTVELASTSGERQIKQFKLGLNAESYDIRITANGSSEYQIDFIDLWGETNDVKGN